jgi:hypothetical protein
MDVLEKFDPKSCYNCRYYMPEYYNLDLDNDADQFEADYGECRRFPPKLVAPEETGFPIVENTSWCGEFDN